MRVLHVAAELFPLVKTGGLADVLGALPQALVGAGAEVRLLLPGYPAVLQALQDSRVVCDLGAMFGAATVTLRLGRLAPTGVDSYVVDAPLLFARQGNPYLDSGGAEWPDNLQRFALLGWVGAHLGSAELDAAWSPHIVHAHDWHAALACAYLAAQVATPARSVFTVHNLAYQGLFDARDFALLGLPARFMDSSALEFHGQLSCMKAGLVFAHRVTTVSPSYAKEIATAAFGCGLEGVVRSRGSAVAGILNGVDPAVWNPATDPAIAQTYSAGTMRGKAQCKVALQKALGLRVDGAAPLLAVVSRLTSQKGLDLILAVLPTLLAQGVQLAVQGSGDRDLENALATVAAAHPAQVALRLGYDEAFAHAMVAGADVMLVPSRFEPCGLTQLYALRYGTVPLVRRVGGLADTVVAVGGPAAAATGFVFEAATGVALAQAVAQALAVYKTPAAWQALRRRGMQQDFSWSKAAAQYLALYQDLLTGNGAG